MPEALLIADPNGLRRKALLQQCAALTGMQITGAATLSETYLGLENSLPTQLAVAAELAELPDFDALADIAAMVGAQLVVYGRMGTCRRRDSRRARYVAGPQELLDLLAAAMPARDTFLPPPVQVLGPPPGQLVRHMICIGASTGGVAALETLLKDFSDSCPPTLVVQHIRPGFVDGLIRRLDQAIRARVTAAEHGATLSPGTIYMAASDLHLGLEPRKGLRLRLIDEGPVCGHRPSVDVLFREAAAVAGRVHVSAALLTGMGADGAAGMAAVRAAGGLTIAQDQQSSVVWGMPRVAIEQGAAAEVLPLDLIGRALLRRQVAAGRGR